jgi:hypothetical protein
MKQLIGIFALMITLAAGGPPVAAQGNSAAAKACQQGGWQDLKGADGTRFKNQGACVSYAAKGGQLVPLEPNITVTFTSTGPINCLVDVFLEDFTPNTAFNVVNSVYNVGNGPIFYSTTPVLTDASGAANYTAFDFFFLPGYEFQAVADNGVQSDRTPPFGC